MRLEDILRAVPKLTAEERQQLRRYLDQLPAKTLRLTPKERTQRLNGAFDVMGESFSPAAGR